MPRAHEHIDVIVVGAGLSGISAAFHLLTRCPEQSFAVLEARAALGGTWDLFRYPGVRSDSDMFTLGFRWQPWPRQNAIAEGRDILEYVRCAAREHGIEPKIRFQQRLKRASWSSESARWTLEIESGPTRELVYVTCGFLCMCPGYYDYSAGHTPVFEGAHEFTGQVVHPQHWHAGVDYAAQRVVVIGSGATAITLVPALAQHAAHVVMLQRSPSYVIAAPARDPLAGLLRGVLPIRLSYALVRWKNILFGMLMFRLMRRLPGLAKRLLMNGVRRELGPDYDVERHFNPRYAVWDQRLCLAPDADFFAAIRSGRCSVVTDEIERFTPRGIRLRSGQELEADLIVTATGLELNVLGGATLEVDGRKVELQNSLNYKGCMFTDVPNLAYTFGYTNASWTLKADLTAEYVCRLVRALDQRGATHCTPRRSDPSVREDPWLDFSSGYVQRALSLLPKQGSKWPFRLYQNYLRDLLMLRWGRLTDRALEFTPRQSDGQRAAPSVTEPAATSSGRTVG